MNEVYQTIIEALTNERLDNIISKDEHYLKATEKLPEISSTLKEELTEEQYQIMEKYIDMREQAFSIYIELAYKQAIQDVFSLLLKIINNS